MTTQGLALFLNGFSLKILVSYENCKSRIISLL